MTRTLSMMNKRTITSLLKQLQASKNRISIERDKLRELISECEEIDEDCTNAIDRMDAAADALSELL